ncbi:right-handed parallel beta-helix repeat-containing protein, partial [Klebsiella pneumoniae]|nr:right-handed parallel beta-helix repeat-containing protein [Klebsiella pneumoniae]
GQALSIYVRPNTPAKIYNREDRSHKFVSDVYLGKIDTTTSSVDEKAGSAGKCHKFITPEYFGATGDGITDDTVCINEAIASGYSVFYSARYL